MTEGKKVHNPVTEKDYPVRDSNTSPAESLWKQDKRLPIISKVLQDFAYGRYNTDGLNVEQQCNWKAEKILAQLAKQVSSVCPKCHGDGRRRYHDTFDSGNYTSDEPCPTCKGTGRVSPTPETKEEI